MSSVAPTSSLVTPEGAERAAENLRDAARGEPPFKTEPNARGRLDGSLLDALAAAGIAAAITLFFLYLRMDVGTGGVSVAFRPWLWLAAIPVVAVARFLLSFFVFRSGKERAGVKAPARSSAQTATAARSRPLAGTAFAVLLLALAFAAPLLILYFLPNQDRYLITLAILIMTYIMLGWGLNIVVGLAGLLDLGYVAFYGVGAYSFALLATNFGLGFWVCLPMAGLFAALWGIMLGFPVLRLRGDYLAIVTLAFGEIIRVVIINWSDVTGGPNGLGRLPAPTFFGLEFKRGAGGFADTFGLPYDTIHRFVFLYYIILALALLTNFITLRMRRLPIGRAWEALREDEIACRSLGINTTNVKLTAFATGAMFGGFAGSFFATSQGSITPESFTYLESATILAIVVLGGLGSQLGIVLSSIVMIGGLEMLRHLTALKSVFGEDFEPTQYRMLIFGAAMIAIMIWKPRGLISFRQPSAVYKERKRIGADLVAQGEGH